MAIALFVSSTLVGNLVQGSLNCLDVFGNPSTDINSNITLVVTFASTSRVFLQTFADGVASFSYEDTVPGLYTFSLVDNFGLGLSVTSTAQLTLLHGSSFIFPPVGRFY